MKEDSVLEDLDLVLLYLMNYENLIAGAYLGVEAKVNLVQFTIPKRFGETVSKKYLIM